MIVRRKWIFSRVLAHFVWHHFNFFSPQTLYLYLICIPLDPAPVMPIPPAFGTSLLPNEEDFKGTTTTLPQTNRGKTEVIKSKNSSAAQTIINSFPLLDFMNHSKLSEPS